MPRNYVDNAMNRSLGRVGMPHGSAVHSRSSGGGSFSSSSSSGSFSSPSSSSSRGYVDNAMNRSLGRVGLPVGTAVHSRGASASSSSPSSSRRYVNNALNQRLGRVGLVVGTAVHRKGEPLPNPILKPFSEMDGKVYKDNAFNRKHKRVGLTLGSKPVRKAASVYQDNPVNQYLGRVGLPMGSKAVPKSQLAKIRDWLKNSECFVEDSGYDDLNSAIFSEYDFNDPEANEQYNDNFDHVVEALNRARQEDIWRELNDKPIQCCTEPSDTGIGLLKAQGKPIEFKDLKILDKIGHGGFGIVYLADYNGQAVAVKVLTQTNLSKNRLNLFEKEIINHSKLDHDNIVRFYGPCLERPKLAIVMEYMDASLFESIHINEVNFLSIHKLHITQDITSGLDYLHSLPLVHGDLKTQNVLLINVPDTPAYDKDQPTRAKLSDFGLSELKSDSETSQSVMLQRKLPVGATLRYAAPEVIRGEMLNKDEMLRTDIYSMGLIIMELVVEATAFEDLTVTQLMKQVGEKGLTPSAPEGLTLDARLERMLQACWSFKPNQRPDARQLKKLAFKLDALMEEE
ncbi:hypothetical protein EGW08_008918 [Elysia chlorotica]|uniref:Protein kinase domain-containing protein n=1 Tax=Elysia chlorotica TaxID=188477 RepID=A0A433TP59_ELYCH|nr:hypothetical protein EGW08_008918 [Elysia chlorotica]